MNDWKAYERSCLYSPTYFAGRADAEKGVYHARWERGGWAGNLMEPEDLVDHAMHHTAASLSFVPAFRDLSVFRRGRCLLTGCLRAQGAQQSRADLVVEEVKGLGKLHASELVDEPPAVLMKPCLERVILVLIVPLLRHNVLHFAHGFLLHLLSAICDHIQPYVKALEHRAFQPLCHYPIQYDSLASLALAAIVKSAEPSR